MSPWILSQSFLMQFSLNIFYVNCLFSWFSTNPAFQKLFIILKEVTLFPALSATCITCRPLKYQMMKRHLPFQKKCSNPSMMILCFKKLRIMSWSSGWSFQIDKSVWGMGGGEFIFCIFLFRIYFSTIKLEFQLQFRGVGRLHYVISVLISPYFKIYKKLPL